MTDRITFIGRPYKNGDRNSGIRLVINNVDLVDLARVVEMPFATAEGSPSIAGAYAGLVMDSHTLPPSDHFLGRPSWSIYSYGAKTQVLGCDCGEPGCWPLVCSIAATAIHVTMAEFEQPHRTGMRGRAAWSYQALGPFTFDRQQYEKALEELRRAGEQRDAADEPHGGW
jgi:hypothetical protein